MNHTENWSWKGISLQVKRVQLIEIVVVGRNFPKGLWQGLRLGEDKKKKNIFSSWAQSKNSVNALAHLYGNIPLLQSSSLYKHQFWVLPVAASQPFEVQEMSDSAPSQTWMCRGTLSKCHSSVDFSWPIHQFHNNKKMIGLGQAVGPSSPLLISKRDASKY